LDTLGAVTETTERDVPQRDPQFHSERAWGFGLATVTTAGKVLDTWYPEPALGTPAAHVNVPGDLTALEGQDDVRGVVTQVVFTEIDRASPPADSYDAYLRLHLLSHRLVKPHELSTDGIFGRLACARSAAGLRR
jgi:2,3,4,5-tetrahydropyridine-2,6-dicarboxylate N-succinyltransferase